MSNHFTGLASVRRSATKDSTCAISTRSSRHRFVENRDHPQRKSNADALHPGAIYRLNIDNDGDLLTNVALSYVFSKPQNGKQTFNVFLAKGAESRSAEAIGKKIVADAEVSFGPKPNLVKAGDYTFFAGSRSDAFFFDFDGIKNLFDIRGKRNFTEPHLSGKSPWTGVDSNTEANVFSTVVELPTSELAPKPEVHIWGRCSVRQDGKLIHVDPRAIRVSAAFSTPTTRSWNTTPASR